MTVVLFASMPKVRPLPSAGISGFVGTRGLSDSPPVRRLARRCLSQKRPIGSLTFRRRPFARTLAITPAAGSIASVSPTDPQRSSPLRWRLDATSALSRPAPHSLALRPVRLLPRHIRGLPGAWTAGSLRSILRAATKANRQLLERISHPLVLHSFT